MNPLYKTVLDSLEKKLKELGDDDEATTHIAIAGLYEELKMPAEAADWYRRASLHCVSRRRSDLEVRYRKAAELLTPPEPSARPPEQTPQLPPQKRKR